MKMGSRERELGKDYDKMSALSRKLEEIFGAEPMTDKLVGDISDLAEKVFNEFIFIDGNKAYVAIVVSYGSFEDIVKFRISLEEVYEALNPPIIESQYLSKASYQRALDIIEKYPLNERVRTNIEILGGFKCAIV